MAKKSYKHLLREAKQTDSYWVEAAKVEFAAALGRLAKLRQLSKADLAGKLGTSKAYVTKVFRGDTNFTIETLIKLGRAVDARLVIDLVPATSSQHRLAERLADDGGLWKIHLTKIVHVEVRKDCPVFGKFVPVDVTELVVNDTEYHESEPAAA